MAKFTYILLMLIIAVLFSGFSFSVGILIHPTPQYNDFCQDNQFARPAPLADGKECSYLAPPAADCTGFYETEYDANGCALSYTCQMCGVEYDAVREDHSVVMLLTLAILGLLAIIIGLYYTAKNSTIEWLLNGFLLGGLVNLFIGTVFFIGDIPALIRPVILLFELVIIVFVSVRKLGRESKKASITSVSTKKSLRVTQKSVRKKPVKKKSVMKKSVNKVVKKNGLTRKK